MDKDGRAERREVDSERQSRVIYFIIIIHYHTTSIKKVFIITVSVTTNGHNTSQTP